VVSKPVPATSRTALLTSLLLACLACTADKPATEHEKEQEAAPTPTGEVTMLTPYFDIGELLAADRIDGLDLLGKATIGTTAQERREVGMDRVHAGAERLGAAADLESARAAYRDMSHALLDYLDAHPERREGAHLMYCPMTFDNQGAYWVARVPEIRNPYEGSRMLECGAKLSWDEAAEHRKRWAAANAPGSP
jgi:hypothetical protein